MTDEDFVADAILLSLSRLNDDTIQVRCDAAHRSATAPHSMPNPGVVADLLFQIRAGTPAAGRALAEVLGAILFGDAPGAIAREALADDPWLLVCLEAADALNDWPWELALDPVTGRCPVAEGLAMVRIGGPSDAPTSVPATGLIVAPGHDPARLDALSALTRGVARKSDLPVERVTPATAQAVRHRLDRGAALLHLDAPAADGGVLVDADRAAIDSLGIDANAWLVIVSGGEAGAPCARALRDAGAQIVVARQIALDPQQSAALDRKLYQCLAKGLTPIEAVRAARAALARRGTDDCAWAAPVLWSARNDARVSAAVPFPPRALMGPATPLPTPIQTMPMPETPATPAPLGARPRHPVSALNFVTQTIELLQLGTAPDDPDLQARLAVLHDLGGDATAQPPAELGEAARVDWLADRLLDSLDHPAEPLALPTNVDARSAQIAFAVGARADDALTFTRALIASPVVALSGDGAARLAAAVAEQLFDVHLAQVTGGPTIPLLGTPGPSQRGDGDGWLYSVAAANWRLEEEWSPEPTARPPASRLPVLAQAAGHGWRAFSGAWLAIRAADALGSAPLRQLLAALDAGVYTGFDDSGFRFQLDLPADFRVILIDPDRLPEWVPLIELTPPSERAPAWLGAARARFGAALDADEAEACQRIAGLLDPILAVYTAITGAPSARMGEAALALAIVHGGPPAEALDEALVALLAPRLSGAARATIRAWLAGDPDAMVNAADERITRGLARHLDAVDPTPVPRLASLAQLGPLAFVTETGLAAPEVALPRLLAALSV